MHTLAWAAEANRYLLECTATLSASNYWQPILTGVTTNDSGQLVYSATNSSSCFYRLHKLY